MPEKALKIELGNDKRYYVTVYKITNTKSEQCGYPTMPDVKCATWMRNTEMLNN